MNDDHAQMVEDCEQRSDRLDDWSVNFIDSIGRQMADGRALTANQIERLEDIWERATAKG